MADHELWSSVDDYINGTVVKPDEALDQALAATDEAGMPAIAVSAPQGKMLHLLARVLGARRILEIGTLGGYSTIWMARALQPGAELISLEISARHAEVARSNVEKAGLSDRVQIRVGPALESLPQLQGPFDLVFIDADKANIPEYFDWAVRLGRPGTIIVVDNVVRNGALIDATSDDPNVAGVRRLHEQLGERSDIDVTTIQTVGGKGYDGFTLALVEG